jgi:hypothetical protein
MLDRILEAEASLGLVCIADDFDFLFDDLVPLSIFGLPSAN